MKRGEPSTLLEAIRTHPSDRVFCRFISKGRQVEITYEKLQHESGKFAAYFMERGVRQGEVVLIILRHCPELLYAFVGAMHIGAIPSFMPHLSSKQEPERYWESHRKLFSRIGNCTLLTHSEYADLIAKLISQPILRVLEFESFVSTGTAFSEAKPSPDSIAFLQHSSGTTGLKKGVALSHRAVLQQIESYANSIRLTKEDHIISWLPLYHDMGLIACFLLPLIKGTPLALLDPFEWVIDPGVLFRTIRELKGTLCWQPNFAFNHLCRTVRPTADLDLSSMRAWINCSEPCRAETFALFLNRFARQGVSAQSLSVCYAMAEAVFAVTQQPFGAPPKTITTDSKSLGPGKRTGPVGDATTPVELLSAGLPIEGIKLRIQDEAGNVLPDGQVGEIAVSGNSMFSGYYKLEEETARKLVDGWYKTGDLGFLADGFLYVTGRKNDLIIVHGKNFYAHDLEFIVHQVEGVHPGRAVAVGWFRPDVGSEDVVVIAEIDGSPDDHGKKLANQIKESVLNQAGLQLYDVHLVPPGWLIKTTSGKISRSENLGKYLAHAK